MDIQPIDLSGRTVWFGPFSLQLDGHRLLEAGKLVPIGSRALDLLILLVQRAGDIVTKDELFAGVWPGLAVDNSNLRVQVALLRRALRDDKTASQYVTTVPGRGYRFAATLSTTAPAKSAARRPPDPALPSILPARLTRLIGREDAISEILARLGRGRFVTIMGPGGIGKTSIAMAVAEQAAHSYEDGLHIVDCAPLLGTSLVARRLASTLGLEIAADDPTHGLTTFLRRKKMLIVLDSCERVIEAAALLAEHLLKSAPGVGVLATSRERLRAEGEFVYPLPPLEIPPLSAGLTASSALTYSAIELFTERAVSSAGGFDLTDSNARIVSDICRGLDGIALAIELAAGRVDVFGLQGVEERLKDHAHLLTHGRRTALPRHQTLAAMLDWSYDSLTEREQLALRQLSVFAGSFTIDGAQAVLTGDNAALSIGDSVTSLLSKSLLNADFSGATSSYRLLDTTRAYAQERLAQNNELDETSRRHANFIKDLLERASFDATTASIEDTSHMSTQSSLIDEARTAMEWAFSGASDVGIGIDLTIATVPLWTNLSLNGECCRYVEQALTAGKPLLRQDDRREMQLLAALGAALVWSRGPGPAADIAFAGALKIADAIDDGDYKIQILWGLWSSHFNSGRIRVSLDTAQTFRDVAARHDDTAATLVGERTIGMSLFYLGDHSNSRQHAEKMLLGYVRPRNRSHIVRFQFDPRIVSRTLLSKLLWAQGLPDQALREAQGVVDEATKLGHSMSLALALAQGACPVALLSGDLKAAERFIALMLRHTLDHALDLWHAWGTCFEAMLLIAHGHTTEGMTALNATLDGLPQGAFFANYAGIQAVLAETTGRSGETLHAHAIIDSAITRSEKDQERWYIAEFLRVKGELFMLDDTPSAMRSADAMFQRSLRCAREQQATSWELRTSISIARLRQAQGHITEARDGLASVYGHFNEGFQTSDLAAARQLIETLS